MITAALIWGAIEAGATLLASKVATAATNDAYEALKKRIVARFGRSTERALAEVEANPASKEASRALESAIPAISDDDAKAIGAQFTALVLAMRADPAAQPALERYQARFDLEADGNVLIDQIENARSIDMRAKAGKDIRLGRINLADQDRPGN